MALDLPLRNVPQTGIERFLATMGEGAESGRDAMNKVFRHNKSGYGLGNLFFGESPELLDEMSWGKSPIIPSGHGGRLDTRLGDIAGVATPLAMGSGKFAKAGLKDLFTQRSPAASQLGAIKPFADKNVYTHISKDDFDFKDFDFSQVTKNNKPFEGIFFNTDKEKPLYGAYTNSLEGKNTKPAYLNLKNPATDDDVYNAAANLGGGYTKNELTAELQRMGFDGYINKNVGEVAVFDTKNIRSLFDVK